MCLTIDKRTLLLGWTSKCNLLFSSVKITTILSFSFDVCSSCSFFHSFHQFHWTNIPFGWMLHFLSDNENSMGFRIYQPRFEVQFCYYLYDLRAWKKKKSLPSKREGFPGGSVVKELACRHSRHRFDPWSGRIPHAMEQLNLCTTAEPVL